MPVAIATGFYQTNQPPFSCSSPPSRSDWGRGPGRGGCVFPSAFGSGVFPIATMESWRCFITEPLAKSPRLASHAIESHTLRDSCRVCVAVGAGKSSWGSRPESQIRRVGLEDLTANTPEPVHDFNLVFLPVGPTHSCLVAARAESALEV